MAGHPYGAVAWVHNASAAGRVTLRRRLDTQDSNTRQVSPQEAGTALKQDAGSATAKRPYSQAGKDPVEDLTAEADGPPGGSSSIPVVRVARP